MILLAVGLVVGGLIGWCARSYGLAQTAVVPPAPPTVIRDTHYQITRNGLALWSGTNGHAAKQWWEHAKVQPGARDLQFLVDGALRDRFTVSA